MAHTAPIPRVDLPHTATHAAHLGVDVEKVTAVWEFEHDDRFSEAERAALRLARDATQVPNQVGEAHFVDLAAHFDEPGDVVATVLTNRVSSTRVVRRETPGRR